ncbi:hypothetical protein, partial [Verminephrobacter aporrectodeae]|uniref:hypothetical protein n=1 Tax=Verminephrobacter aporrectodeae TaxID=1110389 RepID=UPI001F2D9F16
MTTLPCNKDKLHANSVVDVNDRFGSAIPVKWSQSPSSTGHGKSLGNSTGFGADVVLTISG